MELHPEMTHYKLFVLVLLISFASTGRLTAQEADSSRLAFGLQSSVWLMSNNNWNAQLGMRAIPYLRFEQPLPKSSLTCEVSANMFGYSFLNFSSEHVSDLAVKPYRAWLRYGRSHWELRAGLQKISFGTATMLRPLMWFDRLDPRDPLQLTSGVWAILGRFYFADNSNIWAWVLWPENTLRMWELQPSDTRRPEMGARFQNPAGSGELALSIHHRWLNNDKPTAPGNVSFSEQRLGIDGKWDVEVGLWFEASLMHSNKVSDSLPNQHFLTVGADYTFGLGNGLQLTAEHLTSGRSEEIILPKGRFSHFTALSANYPIGIADFMQFIFYHDWTGGFNYGFLSYRHQFAIFDLHLMGWWNPDVYQLPSQTYDNVSFAGQGFQIMAVYNLKEHSKSKPIKK